MGRVRKVESKAIAAYETLVCKQKQSGFVTILRCISRFIFERLLPPLTQEFVMGDFVGNESHQADSSLLM